jgi:CRP-like cAMP-binding protein
MAADLRKLKDKAAELASKAKFKKAAETYRSILEASGKDVASRQKLAEVLRKMGDDAGSVAEYRRVAETYAREGLLIKAIAVCKVILEIDPEHAETQQALAEFYARKRTDPPRNASEIRGGTPHLPPAARQMLAELYARKRGPESSDQQETSAAADGRASAPASPQVIEISPSQPAVDDEVGVELPLPPAETSAEEPAPCAPPGETAELPPELDPALGTWESATTAFEGMIEAAQQARQAGVEPDFAIEVDEPVEALPELPDEALEPALPHIPLFSDLSAAAFQALTDRIALKRVVAEEQVVRQGDPGDRFYVIASGLFRVEKAGETGGPTVVARLQDGAFFGEMALLSGEPRAASVVAEGDGELLEIRADDLRELCREHPHVSESLARFYRHRLLCNAMATSPLFRPFDRKERKEIMLQFRTRPVAAGSRVIDEGQPSDGLYVVLSGSLAVNKRQGSSQVLAGVLREGDVFGEMSCLRKTPASATVVARRACMLLRLPRDRFDTLIVTYPQILELVANLTDQRQRSLEQIATLESAGGDEVVVLV